MYCDIESYKPQEGKQMPFLYLQEFNFSFPDIMEFHEVTYLGKDCGEHLAITILTYEDKFKRSLNLNVSMTLKASKANQRTVTIVKNLNLFREAVQLLFCKFSNDVVRLWSLQW